MGWFIYDRNVRHERLKLDIKMGSRSNFFYSGEFTLYSLKWRKKCAVISMSFSLAHIRMRIEVMFEFVSTKMTQTNS